MSKNYDTEEFHRHGGCYDRGDSDAYYWRPYRPHYFKGDTYQSEEVTEENMTAEEIAAYKAGYEENPCGKKDWG